MNILISSHLSRQVITDVSDWLKWHCPLKTVAWEDRKSHGQSLWVLNYPKLFPNQFSWAGLPSYSSGKYVVRCFWNGAQLVGNNKTIQQSIPLSQFMQRSTETRRRSHPGYINNALTTSREWSTAWRIGSSRCRRELGPPWTVGCVTQDTFLKSMVPIRFYHAPPSGDKMASVVIHLT